MGFTVLIAMTAMLFLGCVDDVDSVPQLPSHSDSDANRVPLHAFFAVHLEPGKPSVVDQAPNPERGHRYFRDLARLVESADDYDHKLTLMFTPQWGTYVASAMCVMPDDGDGDMATYAYQGTEVSSCLELVQAWFKHGQACDAPSSVHRL